MRKCLCGPGVNIVYMVIHLCIPVTQHGDYESANLELTLFASLY